MGLTRTAGLLIAVICQPYPGKLPACFRREEIAVGGADVRARSGARSSAQDHLAAHEFSVVFTQRTGRGLVSRISKIGAGRPLPDIAKQLKRLAVFTRRRSGLRMKPAVLQKIVFHRRCAAGGDFPFKLGGQAGAGPAGKSISLVITHVADRFGFFDVAHSRASEMDPLAAGLFPVERRFPMMGLHGLPAVRKPQLRSRVPAIVYERKIFSASCQSHGETERPQKHFVPRAFIVKIKRFAFSSDLVQSLGIRLRFLLRRAAGRRRYDGGLIRGMERVAPEAVLDIGDEQFLVLLLMVEAERYQLLDL